MVSEESGEPAGHDMAESLIDDLIRDILNEAGQSTKSRARGGGDPMAALIETAIASSSNAPPRASVLERILLTQALASALADALAPALAEALAPEVMKALDHYGSDGNEEHRTAPATRTAKGRKKTT
ncbi:hypothetical protein [Actinomadura rugatobispora]|uniref:DUF2267 domain-containing protein n=1 Tax=Actinomadura rugatobispora TaxID=1994 RepID=A0ABW1A1T3_9ACTN|nr:hypothetical protein GCM10010200_062600 [Actinomadura rugatobispora]